jgi:hypothetical protein
VEEYEMDLPSDALTAPSTAERGYPLFVPESEAPPAESPLPSQQPPAESPLPQFDAYETLLSASSYSDEDFGRPRRKRREDGTKEPWSAVDVPNVDSSEDDNIPIAQTLDCDDESACQIPKKKVTSISRHVNLMVLDLISLSLPFFGVAENQNDTSAWCQKSYDPTCPKDIRGKHSHCRDITVQ